MTRSDLQELANVRLRESQILFAAGAFSGSYYLVGYAVECALKACIAKRTQQFDFPDKTLATQSHTHKLKDLLKVAELDRALSDFSETNLIFNQFWAVVLSWSEESRYKIWQQQRAASLIQAVSDLEHGVMSWLKLHW